MMEGRMGWDSFVEYKMEVECGNLWGLGIA